MHIIIIGGGSIGRKMAESLIAKKQNIIVIDKDKKVIESLRQSMDIKLIHGNGANVDILEKAKIRSARMVISVMANDDANIFACMIAKTISASVITIARVRNPESAGSIDIDTRGLTQQQVGLDVIISPEKAVAQEMIKYILFPNLDDVMYFAKESVQMIGITLSENTEITGKKISDLVLPKNTKIIGIFKENNQMLLPGNNDILEANDKIYLIGSISDIRTASSLLYNKESKIKRIVILGGELIGMTLAQELEMIPNRSFIIKIIEPDPILCEELNKTLSKSIVIPGDSGELSFYNEEEMQDADLLAIATNDDRINIICYQMANKLNVPKTISANVKPEYTNMYKKMGVESLITQEAITVEKILRYIHRENVLSLCVLEKDTEVFEMILEEGAPVCNKTIADAEFPKEMTIAAIIRNGELIIPENSTILKASDNLVVIALAKVCFNLEKFFLRSAFDIEENLSDG